MDTLRETIARDIGGVSTRVLRRRSAHLAADRLTMKHVIYEDPITHKFALVRLPDRFVQGDNLPILATERWFQTHEEAVAALPALLDLDD